MRKKQWILIIVLYFIYIAITLFILNATGGFEVPDWWKG